MRRITIELLVALAFGAIQAVGASSAPHTLPHLVGDHAAAAALLKASTIPVGLEGQVELPYEQVIARFMQGDLLTEVQEAYKRVLPAEKEPEFTIRQSEPGHYFYVNKARQRTDIQTVCGGVAEAEAFHVIYHAAGKRFFGHFQSLTHVTLRPSEQGVSYRVRVLAYPENGVSRFFIRRLRVIERFFKKKTAEMTALIEDICTEMISEDAPADTSASAG
jgi:hypothetical protein